MAEILVIDDNSELANSIADNLENARYEVDVAYNFEQAVRNLTQGNYDGIVSDFSLTEPFKPEKTGVALAGFLKAQGKKPFFMLQSSYEEDMIALKAPEYNALKAEGYISACVDKGDLLSNASKVVGKYFAANVDEIPSPRPSPEGRGGRST